MNISIFGAGYVGLTTAVCLADQKNNVVCRDIDKDRIEMLKKGKIPFFEPELDKLIKKNLKKRRISFTVSANEAIRKSKVIFIAVGTPHEKNGKTNLSYIEAVSDEIGKNLNGYAVIVNKSTVPVGTWSLVSRIIRKNYKGAFDVVSNPEFLREGSAVYDFVNPERIVIGSNSERARKLMNSLYSMFSCPIVNTGIETAEMIKYASNAFLATKISFINEIANVCERVGANIDEVSYAMGLDSRIGSKFLNAGIGYGGSCFPKDIKALRSIANVNNYNFRLLKSVININNDQRLLAVKKTKSLLGNLGNKKICVWGLAFKPNTDDIRESAAIDIIKIFRKSGAEVSAYDPKANYKIFKRQRYMKKVNLYKDKYEALKNCDALVIATEWEEFKNADLKKIKKTLREPNIIDGRNIYNPSKVKRKGFRYAGIGR